MQFVTESDVTMSQLPRMTIMSTVSNSEFPGIYDESPYDFAHFDSFHVTDMIDGVFYPGRGHDRDYDTVQAIGSYGSLLNCLNRLSGGNKELFSDRF